MAELNVKGLENEYGVELLKKFFEESIELGKVVDEQLEDGWQWTDLWKIVGEAKDLTFVWKQWSEVKEQFEDLTKSEIIELSNTVVAELGLTNENVLSLITNIIEFAEATYNLVLSFKQLKGTSIEE